MAIDRVKVTLASGGVVGNAVMNWYFTAVTAANLTAINTFLTASKTYFPTGLTYTIPGGGDTIDETTGKLLGAWAAGAASSVLGTSASPGAGQAGVMVRWTTGAVVDGHHPRGRCLLVPMGGNAFTSTGTVNSTLQSSLAAAASTFLSSSSGFIIWHRPKYDRTTKPPTLLRPGSVVPALAAIVPTTSVTLRSRNH